MSDLWTEQYRDGSSLNLILDTYNKLGLADKFSIYDMLDELLTGLVRAKLESNDKDGRFVLQCIMLDTSALPSKIFRIYAWYSVLDKDGYSYNKFAGATDRKF